jgi:hypothetical protein
MASDTLRGVVRERSEGGNPFYRIECPDAPPHLQTMFLRPWQMGSATTGDHVELRYQALALNSGHVWNVSRIITKGTDDERATRRVDPSPVSSESAI